MGAPFDSNLPPPATLSTAQRGPAHCPRLHKRDSAWDSSYLADDSFEPYSVGKKVLWTQAYLPQYLLDTWAQGHRDFKHLPREGRVGSEPPFQTLLAWGGSSKHRPCQSQRNKHQHISINNTSSAGKFGDTICQLPAQICTKGHLGSTKPTSAWKSCFWVNTKHFSQEVPSSLRRRLSTGAQHSLDQTPHVEQPKDERMEQL